MNENEQIIFIQNRVPGLRSGTYTVTVDEVVKIDGGEDKTYSVTRHFQVRGERFSIRDDEIHSVFPPEKSTGPYLGCVPHVLFNRAMLPWLRGLSETALKTTWLAVLLFDPDEMPAVTVQKTVRDLVQSGVAISVPTPGGTQSAGKGALPSDTLSYPFASAHGGCELEYGESG